MGGGRERCGEAGNLSKFENEETGIREFNISGKRCGEEESLIHCGFLTGLTALFPFGGLSAISIQYLRTRAPY